MSPRNPLSKRRIAIAFAFILAMTWEAYWLWEYVAAPRPDYEMRSVAALFFGGVLPALIVTAVCLEAIISWCIRRSRDKSYHIR